MDSEKLSILDRQALADLVEANLPINAPLLFRKAEKIACNNTSVATASNAISLYAMFVLKEILAQQALNPTTNVTNIANISNVISFLNENLTINIL